MYHQENDCNLIGPPDEISTIGSDSLSFSSAESSATSVEILTTVMESQVSVISDHRESSLERSESKQHEGAQSLLLSTSGPHVQEMPSNLSEFPLNEHAYNISQSIQENYSNVGDKFIAINGIEEGQILQEENPAFVSNSGPSSQHFTDPLVIKNLEEETHSVDEKSASIVQYCERILTIDGQQDEMHTGHLKSKQVQDDTETTSLEKMTPVATSVNKVVACPPLQQADFLKNCVSNTLIISERSEQSCPLAQLQEDTTIPTLSTCSKCSPLDVKSKEDLSNNSKSYSPPATPPLGGPSFDELPRFTSQRPSNLPSTAGKRSTFANWNSSSVDQR